MSLVADIDMAKRLGVQGCTVGGLLDEWVRRVPAKPFLIWAPFSGQPEAWTYSAFDREVAAVARGLLTHGVRSGTRVMLHMDNSPEFLLAWFACVRLDAVVVTTNTRSSVDELGYFIEKAQPVAILTQAPFVGALRKVCGSRPLVAAPDRSDPEGRPVVETVEGAIPWRDLPREGDPLPASAAGPMSDLAIQFTSGTTSRAKGVVWTHANAVFGAQLNARHLLIRHDDVCQVCLPLFHTNAQSYGMLTTLWSGGTLVVQPRFSARNFWSAAVAHRATWHSTIPFCVKALLQNPVPADHRFRFWLTAVALPDVADPLLGFPTMGLWGMTETITQGIVADPMHPGPSLSIGRASPAYDIRIVDDEGAWIGPGGTGRLHIRGVRGVSLFKEYLDDPEATAKCFDADGWFDTGDRIRMDVSGDLYFVDRDKDMLKVGGENVSAAEIETAILASGLVDEVAVVGQKHFMLDEVPVAFVIAKPDAPADLAERVVLACRERLADFKVVRGVHVVEALPRSTLEKIAKNVLRDRLPAIEA
ncbi:MAG TPA: AMP-binding protein [Nevskiaceae bacterium]|nr:AMP-binding protein [Nevskiaceae bacterium]